MALFSLICCLLALTSSVLSNSAYGRAPVSWSTGSSNDNSKVTGLRELTQGPMQTGYGGQQQQQQQQNTDLSLGSATDLQQDNKWQTLVSSPRVITASGFGAQVPRSQITFGQNEQAVVAPQSNYGGQQLTRQVTLGQNEQNVVAPQSNYGGQQLTRQVQLGQNEQSVFVPQSNYGGQRIAVSQPRAYVSPKQLLLEQQQLLQQKIDEAQIVTEADVLCRGKQPETIIPLDNGRRFVTCLDDGKGYEQQCPKGLILHPETRRCERKSGPLDNPCANYPCLNNGKCVQTDHSSYECQCQIGYDGTHCELDARVCHTQKPCGQSPDIKCQSFRENAALTHVCVHKSGQAYGLSSQLTHGNPCRAGDDDVPKPLGVSDGGFVMCDGDSMYVESCPGGTVWSNNQKSCVWAETEYINALTEQPQIARGYGQQVQYNQQPRTITTQSGYGGEVQIERPLPKARTLVEIQRPSVNEEQRVFQGYGQGTFQQEQIQQQPNPRSQVVHQSVGRQQDFRHVQPQQPSNY